jgi:spermidine/putrescine transport system substrate-binding protein
MKPSKILLALLFLLLAWTLPAVAQVASDDGALDSGDEAIEMVEESALTESDEAESAEAEAPTEEEPTQPAPADEVVVEADEASVAEAAEEAMPTEAATPAEEAVSVPTEPMADDAVEVAEEPAATEPVEAESAEAEAPAEEDPTESAPVDEVAEEAAEEAMPTEVPMPAEEVAVSVPTEPMVDEAVEVAEETASTESDEAESAEAEAPTEEELPEGVPPQMAEEDKPVLTILNWSEFIDLDESVPEDAPMDQRSPTLRSFAERYGCRIDYVEYDDGDEMFERLAEHPGAYDVVITDTVEFQKLLDAGRLAKMTDRRVPNRKHIQPAYRTVPDDPEGRYFAAYLAGTTGIAYRRDIVGGDVDSWSDFFFAPDGLKGQIALQSEPDAVFMGALIHLGLPVDTYDVVHLRRAGRLILDMKNRGVIGRFDSSSESLGNSLVDGSLAMAIMYSGDALSYMEENENIRYVVPEEGGAFFSDKLMVLEDAPQKDLAFHFVNFVLEPEVHARIAIHCLYVCPNEAALKIIGQLAPDPLGNPAMYPDPATLARCHTTPQRHPEVTRLWARISE